MQAGCKLDAVGVVPARARGCPFSVTVLSSPGIPLSVYLVHCSRLIERTVQFFGNFCDFEKKKQYGSLQVHGLQSDAAGVK